jgi:hypothetical protein
MSILSAVHPGTPDYVRVEDELRRLDCRLLKLEEISNPIQEKPYESMKVVIQEEVAREGGGKGANEHTFLFHGTSSVYAAEGITRSGFDNRYFNLDGKFGAGTYLASDLAKSHSYTKVIPEAGGRVVFVCKALLGKLEELYEKKERVARAGPKPGFQTVHWNGLTKAKPSASGFYDEYIVYRYGQAVPRLKITYCKNNEVQTSVRPEKSASQTLNILGLLQDTVKRFCNDEQLGLALRDFTPLLTRCREVVVIMYEQDIQAVLVLGRLAEEVMADAALLEKWHAELGRRFNIKAVLQSKARLSRLASMMASIRSMHEELMQVVQAHASGESILNVLSSARKGQFTDYQIVSNVGARKFWRENFPGRKRVGWGEFYNALRWEDFMERTDDLNRTRAFFWLKSKYLDPVDIEAWANFTKSGEPFEKLISALFSVVVPGEDTVDAIHTLSEGKASDQKQLGNEQLSPQELLEKLEIVSSQPESGGAWSVEIGVLMDCTKTMGKHIDLFKSFAPSLFEKVQSIAFGARVRLAFIGYRDIGDVDPLTIFPFSSSAAEFVAHLDQFGKASGGGGDAAEDVLGGLEGEILFLFSKD